MASWTDSDDIKTVFVQGVIPLVVGISLGILGILHVFFGCSIFSLCKKHDDQVAPAVAISMNNGTNTGASNDNDNSATRGRAYGPVACKAQLYGMQPSERIVVLEAIFSSCCTQKEALAGLTKNKAESDESPAGAGKEQAAEEDEKMERGDLHLDTECACAICLRDYEDDDVVMTGTNCAHKFHKHCAMAWMTNQRRPKDHCPFCRTEMMTPVEMKKAALEVLGEARVAELVLVENAAGDNRSSNANSNNQVIDTTSNNNNTSNADTQLPGIENVDVENAENIVIEV